MKPLGRAFSFWIAGALALVAVLAPTTNAAAQSTGTVTAQVRYCTGLSYQGLLDAVGPDCVAGPASFTFYLHGDGTDDSWNLSVGDSGEGSIALEAGVYDVWTAGGPIFNVTVPENGATSFAYGFPREAPAEPAPEAPVPPAEPAPVAETATLNVNTYACTGVVGAPIALADVGPDCTRIATNLDFYLWGDGTDDSWNLSTSASGPVAIDLQVGGYEVVNTNTWATLGTQVPSGGATLNIGYAAVAAPAPPAPAPAPDGEVATLTVNTYECTGVSGAPIALVDIGPDCTRIATNLDFYLWGDGTDDHWNLSTSATGPVSIDLQAGGYEVVNTMTWETLGTQLPASGATLSIGYAAEAAPAPAPVAETATLNVNTYACTGVSGAPIALVDIGPDCTRIATNLDFYLWGDGTDDSWNLSTSATGPVSIDLQVGGYEVVNTSTWETLGTQLPSGGATLSIGYAAVAPVETGTVNVSAYECTGLDSAGVLNEIGPDCTPTSGDFTFYLWGDGTDDYEYLAVGTSGTGSIVLPVGDYEVVEENTQVHMQITVTADGTVDLAFGFPAS